MKIFTALFLLSFLSLIKAQQYPILRTSVYADNHWEEQSKNVYFNFINQDKDGVWFTTINNLETRVFKWSEWERTGNIYSFKIEGGALYVLELVDGKIKYIFMTIDSIVGDKNVGYEKKTLKWKFEI